MIIPRLSLVQPQTHDPGDARPGQLLDSITGMAMDSALIVPIRIQKGRTYFPEGSERPVCFSSDGMTPHANVEQPVSPGCVTCKLGQWDKSTNPNKPPQCRDRYTVLGMRIVAEGGIDCEYPFLMNVSGSSIKALKAMITFGQLRRLQPHQFSATLCSVEKRAGAGKFYSLDFRGIHIVSPLDKYAAHAAALMRGGQSEQSVAVAEEELPF